MHCTERGYGATRNVVAVHCKGGKGRTAYAAMISLPLVRYLPTLWACAQHPMTAHRTVLHPCLPTICCYDPHPYLPMLCCYARALSLSFTQTDTRVDRHALHVWCRMCGTAHHAYVTYVWYQST
eukprot:349143-Rhodomonas_salina.1